MVLAASNQYWLCTTAKKLEPRWVIEDSTKHNFEFGMVLRKFCQASIYVLKEKLCTYCCLGIEIGDNEKLVFDREKSNIFSFSLRGNFDIDTAESM